MNIYIYIKSIFDYLFAVLLAIFLSPLLLIIAIVIKLDSKGPVLFKQRRMGRDNTEFEIYKFRSMRIDAPKDLPTHIFTSSEAYITSFGNILRKLSLDELPQVFNILKGEMSFVGPRPALWNQYDLIQGRAKTGSHTLKPGITGWAQINGRDEISVQEKIDFDQYYYDNISLFLDAKILLLTAFQVIWGKGISEGGPK